MQKLLTFLFSKTISIYAIFNNLSFNDMLTNDIVSFKQLGPGHKFESQLGSITFMEIDHEIISRSIWQPPWLSQIW